MRKTIVLLSILLSLSYLTVNAQNYKSAIGGRLGDPLAATYKHFLKDSNNALEFIVGWEVFDDDKSFALTVLYEKHHDLFDSDIFQVYYGYGGNIGTNNSKFRIGVDGVGGLDFNFKNKPINISFDFKPAIYFGDGLNLVWGGGLAVRYILKRD